LGSVAVGAAVDYKKLRKYIKIVMEHETRIENGISIK
jgi:hypothetical protein